MNHEEYVRYKDWCDRVYDDQKDRLKEAILSRVNTDKRVESRQEHFLALFGKCFDRFDRCEDMGIDKFKTGLLSSGDDDEYMVGVLLHNAFQSLYVEDFKDDVIIPSETENRMKRKELQALRNKHNPDTKPSEKSMEMKLAALDHSE
jgi:hypothetical protein